VSSDLVHSLPARSNGEESNGRRSPVTLSLSGLSGGYSPRQIRLDDDHVAALSEVLDQLPPILVDAKTMTVIDGLHRLEAFKRARRSQIAAVLCSCDEVEAVVIAIRSNVRHGRPLSIGEREAAVLTLLERCPERSDRWFAEVCGLSHTTVSKLRSSSGSAANVRQRMGRDGRLRPVDPRSRRDAIARQLATDPGASFRSIATAVGVAPSTVHRVANRMTTLDHLDDGPAAHTVAIPSGGWINDPAFASAPPFLETARWLDGTYVTSEDLNHHLAALPMGRTYQVVDECRRRVVVWKEIADALEARLRKRDSSNGAIM
jgi:hypothetical protein